MSNQLRIFARQLQWQARALAFQKEEAEEILRGINDKLSADQMNHMLQQWDKLLSVLKVTIADLDSAASFAEQRDMDNQREDVEHMFEASKELINDRTFLKKNVSVFRPSKEGI